MSNFVTSTVLDYILALLGARTSTGTVMDRFGSCIRPRPVRLGFLSVDDRINISISIQLVYVKKLSRFIRSQRQIHKSLLLTYSI